MVLGKLYNFLGLVKWKIIIPKSWDCGEDEMREYMCPKEVPIGDLRYASVGLYRARLSWRVHGVDLSGHSAPRGRTHPWYQRPYVI